MKPPAMKTKPTSPTRAAKQIKSGIQSEGQPMMAELYRRAETRLRKQRKSRRTEAGVQKPAAGPQRLLHELQVHQVELEMQNAELHEARDRMEALLEKYTDLYDFAPVGYFSLDEMGRIMEVNLTGAALLGVDRSRLINLPLPRFVAPASKPDFLAFLKHIFAETRKQVGEALLLKPHAAAFWARFHGVAAISASDPRKCCRVAVWDITSLKEADEAQARAKVMADSNLELRREIIRRQKVEESLRVSEQHQCRLLEQSHLMQEKLRHLSRKVLRAQEDERKRISRELHDVIAQTLTGINIRLATLKKEASVNTKGLARNIARTQRLVEKSVDLVHQFALELRPAVLDDLGLIPALHSFMKSFATRTGIHASLMTHALKIDSLDAAGRTVLFRVAQEALINVDRHAHASRVEVRVQKLPDSVCMTIKDDGKSFEVQRVLHAKENKRLGLLGMRERLEMVGGHFDVESIPGKGTTITAQMPLGNLRGGGGITDDVR
jgi:PAS domain S-box-containing protein